MDNTNNSKAYRAENAAQYESQATEISWHGHEILFGLMYEFVEAGQTLLDIGIGTGLSSSLFHKAGLQISGFDSSPDMLAGCKAKGFRGKVVAHDLQALPYPYETDSCRHVISLAVLNFFEDLAPIFQEAARIIQSGGVFGFTVEEKKAGQEAYYTIHIDGGTGQGRDSYDVAMHRHSDRLIKELLENAGFCVTKEHEFLAERYPEQGIEVVFKVYIARRY